MQLLVLASALLACASAQNQLGGVYSQSPGTFAYRTPYSYAFQGVGGPNSAHTNGLPGTHAGVAAGHNGFAGFQGGFPAAHGGNLAVHAGVGNAHHASALPHSSVALPQASAALPQASASYGGLLRDTPEVAAAKAAFFKSFNEAAARAAAAPDDYVEPAGQHGVQGSGPVHGGHVASVFPAHAGFSTHAGQGFGASHLTSGAQFAPAVAAARSDLGNAPRLGSFPTIYAGGRQGSAIPLQVQDTPEVAAAKAEHFKAHAQAQRLAGPAHRPAHS